MQKYSNVELSSIKKFFVAFFTTIVLIFFLVLIIILIFPEFVLIYFMFKDILEL